MLVPLGSWCRELGGRLVWPGNAGPCPAERLGFKARLRGRHSAPFPGIGANSERRKPDRCLGCPGGFKRRPRLTRPTTPAVFCLSGAAVGAHRRRTLGRGRETAERCCCCLASSPPLLQRCRPPSAPWARAIACSSGCCCCCLKACPYVSSTACPSGLRHASACQLAGWLVVGSSSQMRTLAAALVALAASAQALTVSECTSAGSAATVTYDTTKACFKGTVSVPRPTAAVLGAAARSSRPGCATASGRRQARLDARRFAEPALRWGVGLPRSPLSQRCRADAFALAPRQRPSVLRASAAPPSPRSPSSRSSPPAETWTSPSTCLAPWTARTSS